MGRYDHLRDKLRPPAAPAESGRRPVEWDPLAPPDPNQQPLPVRTKINLLDGAGESERERHLRMLNQLSLTCLACTMCGLGRRYASHQGDALERDPHVFSNMNPSRFMVVGQNPGWEELRERTPFVGPSGDNFDRALARHGLRRHEFYICNVNRCWSEGNVRPSPHQRQMCSPFLQMEINLLKPRLVVALGSAAFTALCPQEVFGRRLRQITDSPEFGVKVFAVYHPSPRNLSDPERAAAFDAQIRTLCGLVRALRRSDNDA